MAEKLKLVYFTLRELRKLDPCPERYQHLIRALGGLEQAVRAKISPIDILQHNGYHDLEWVRNHLHLGHPKRGTVSDVMVEWNNADITDWRMQYIRSKFEAPAAPAKRKRKAPTKQSTD